MTPKAYILTDHRGMQLSYSQGQKAKELVHACVHCAHHLKYKGVLLLKSSLKKGFTGTVHSTTCPK